MDRYQLTKRVALMGIIANVSLLAAKLSVGFISRSQAMIADGFNSAGDVFASAMTFVGNKISSKPQDENHPFGHGKAEYIFSMIISFSLLLVAYKIFRDSLDSIITKATFSFSWWLVGIAVFTIILKLYLFIYTRQAGKKEENLLILANSEDHRNDVFVTSSTLLGIVMGNFGINWVDGAVGIGISLWIAFTGVKIFRSSYIVLMDTSIDQDFQDDIIEVVKSVKGVDHVDSITAKPVGISFVLIVKVSVIGELTVNQGHSVAAQIKEDLLHKCKNINDVVVHVNPA